MRIRSLTLCLLAGFPLATATAAAAGERVAASVAVEIVESVGIDSVAGDLALALTGQDGLVYDVVVPPVATARDERGRTVEVELSTAGSRPAGTSWILQRGHDVVEIEASGHRETIADPHETVVFIAYQ